MKRNAGFTLIELMIVTEIIAIIAAMALPNFVRARVQSNESTAAANLRTILDAQIAYNSAHNVYAPDFEALTTPTPPFLSGGDWAAARTGYVYRMEVQPGSFAAYATPQEFGQTGWRGFFIDPSGIVRSELGAEATASSTPLGG